MPPRKTLEDVYRIFDAIQPDAYGCHNYPGGSVGHYVSVIINGKSHKVHRVALERKLGRPIKPGYLALHTCDNPSCCNPDHLFEGTHKDKSFDHFRDPNSPWRLKLKARVKKTAERPKSKAQIKRAMWIERQRLIEQRKKRK